LNYVTTNNLTNYENYIYLFATSLSGNLYTNYINQNTLTNQLLNYVTTNNLTNYENYIYLFATSLSGNLYKNYINQSTLNNYIQVNSDINIQNNFNSSAISNPIINGICHGTGDGCTYSTFDFGIASWYGIGFIDSCYKNCNIVFDVRYGNTSQTGQLTCNNIVLNGSANVITCGSYNITQNQINYLSNITSDVQNQFNTINNNNLAYHYLFETSISSNLYKNYINSGTLNNNCTYWFFFRPKMD